MNLTLFFRLILMSIFQKLVTYNKKSYFGENMSYGNQIFFCPRVVAKDGFSVSLQIHNGNYASSEAGYRQFDHTMNNVEFGFPSENEPLMHKYSESYGCGTFDQEGNDVPFDPTTFNIMDTVGNIPIAVMEEVFQKHGGIDWEATISEKAFKLQVYGNQ